MADPFYGKPNQSGFGLVIGPDVSLGAGGKMRIGSSGLDPFELRRSVLYWDKLSWPSNNIFEFGGDGVDEEYLIKCGILERTPVHFSGGLVNDILIQSQIEVFQQKDRKEPGKWAMTEFRSIDGADATLPIFSTGRGTLVGLFRAIPVPESDVSLEDILNFKEQRKSEFLELRLQISGLYESVISAADSEMALAAAISNIEARCFDAMRVASESKIRFRVGDLGLNFNASFDAFLKVSKNAAVGAAFGAHIGMPTLGGFLGATSSFISLKSGIGLKTKENKENPFRVVGLIHEELKQF